MYKTAVLLIAALTLMLPACAMWDADEPQQEEVSQKPVGAAPAGQQQQREPSAAVAQPQTQPQAQTQEYMGVAPKVEDLEETLVLEAKNGNVSFTHRQHAKMNDCATCHQGTPGKIEGFGKDKAHDLCIGCHKKQNAGPTKCGECHKKS